MKQTIGLSQFTDAFMAIRPNNFSYEGLTWLFDWIEEQENNEGIEQELDVIALCCDFSESSYEEVIKDYDLADDEYEDPETMQQAVIDYLNSETIIVGYDDDKIVYLNF
jgi:hypothetical protein